MTVVRPLLARVRGAAGLLVGSTLARGVSIASWAALLAVPAWTAGRMAVGDTAPSPAFVVSVMVLLAVVKAVGRFAEQYLGHVAAFRIMTRMRTTLYDRLVPLAPAVTESIGSGRLLSAAVRDVDRVEVFFAHTLAPAVTAAVLPAGAVVVVAIVAGPAPAAVLGASFAAALVLLLCIGRRASAEAARRLVAARAELAQAVSDDVRARTELVVFGATENRARRIDDLGDAVARALRSSSLPLALRAGTQTGWQLVAILALVVVGAPRVSDGSLALADLLLAIALVPGTAPALASVEAFGRSLPAGLESARRLAELERREPAVVEPPTPVEFDAPVGELHWSDVRFAYPGGNGCALDGLDLHIEAGSVVAVVGASGSGKSTLARLLTRTWDPDSGNVRIDGRDLRCVSSADLRRAVTVVEQRPILLSGTIRDNLRLACPTADDATLRSACDDAALDLDDLEHGLDTVLGEDGARLSGGQAQRLALARGYLRRTPVLVLDETTSHQDPLTQRRILDRMRRAAPCTIVLITHRAAVLAHVDRVHVLEEGRVVESGTPAQLLAAGGALSHLMADVSEDATGRHRGDRVE